MVADEVALSVRGVTRCPACDIPLLWFAHQDGHHAVVVQLSKQEVKNLVREFAGVPSSARSARSLVVRAVDALGGRIVRAHLYPNGRGGLRAELRISRGAESTRIPASLVDAAALVHRFAIPLVGPRSLLVSHQGSPVPACPAEDRGLPPAPEAFLEFLERARADQFEVERP